MIYRFNIDQTKRLWETERGTTTAKQSILNQNDPEPSLFVGNGESFVFTYCHRPDSAKWKYCRENNEKKIWGTIILHVLLCQAHTYWLCCIHNNNIDNNNHYANFDWLLNWFVGTVSAVESDWRNAIKKREHTEIDRESEGESEREREKNGIERVVSEWI